MRRYVDRHQYIVDRVKARRVLDFGVVGLTCEGAEERSGEFEASLHWAVAASAAQAVGADYASDIVHQLSLRYPHMSLIACSIYDAAEVLKGEQFDTIILGDILEHLDNPGMALDAVVPLLASNGEVIVSCPNAFGLPNYLRFLTGLFEEGPDHVLTFNKFTLSRLLERHRLRIAEIMTCVDRPHSSLRFRAARWALARFPELGGTLLIAATRQPEI